MVVIEHYKGCTRCYNICNFNHL